MHALKPGLKNTALLCHSVTLLYSATVTNRCCLAAEGKEVRICVLISLRCMMLSSQLRQSTRLLRGNAQGAARGNVNTRRNQARQQPYPDESPRTAAARETRSRVAPENSRTTPVSTGAAASVSTVIPSPNTRGAAASRPRSCTRNSSHNVTKYKICCCSCQFWCSYRGTRSIST